MALVPVTKKIGDHTYRVTPLGALAGTHLLVRLCKLAGISASAFIDGSSNAPGIEQALSRGAGDALRTLMQDLKPDETVAILTQLAETTTVVLGDREPKLDKLFDLHFAGRYGEMFAWAQFAMETNFASFISGRGGVVELLQRALSLVGLRWQSQTTLNGAGPSTESPPVENTAAA